MSKARELLELLGEAKKDKMDKEISRGWTKYASGIQVDIMDMPAIFRDIKSAVEGGESMEKAVKDAVKKYRKN